jgi:DNA-directed RNA polymerase subunit RPC12/RpoP
MYQCKACGKEFEKDWRKESSGEPLFCSRSCANSLNNKGKTWNTKREYYCRQCGELIGKGTRYKRRVLCSKCRSKIIIDSKDVSSILNRWITNEDVSSLISSKTGAKKGELLFSFQKLIKKFLLDKQVHCCAICGNSDKWNGNVLTFILDHIDGNYTNQKRDNFRLICPNCNSLLLTTGHTSISRGHGRRSKMVSYYKIVNSNKN